MDRDLYQLEAAILDLNRGKRRGRVRPHKLVMLLALIELIECGLLEENRIYYGQTLTDCFVQIFERYRQADDLCQPAPPFFHLRTAPFWFHKVKAGREKEYGKLRTSGGGSKRILENIEYAYLGDHAFRVLQQDTTRERLRAFIENLLHEEE